MPAVMLLVFALTLFCSATLLFLIEPMVGKMMLPLLGGTPAVWNTCMVFFQAILLAGYAYSHATTSWLGSRKQAPLQLAVLFLPFLSFAINGLFFSGLVSPNENLILGREANPIPALLLVLTLSVGLPMFVICTSAPLLQRWFSSTDHPAARDPYFLYGASNLGSMLSLLGYPLIVEPYLSLRNQQIVFVVGYTLLAILVFVCAVLMWRSRPAFEPATEPVKDPTAPTRVDSASHTAIQPGAGGRHVPFNTEKAAGVPSDGGPVTQPVTWARRLRWLALAVVPSSLMLGVTTYITTDIAAIPLLWVLPLTLYLLTFIIVFAHISPRTQGIVTLAGLGALLVVMVVWVVPMFLDNKAFIWLLRVIGIGILIFSFQILKYPDPKLIHRVMIMAMPLLVLLLIFMMLSDIKPNVVANILLHLSTLFIVSMVCHGELAQDRPAPSHLTEFFLWMSIGGVLGGLFNALFAPVVFNSLVEYPLMMAVACLLLPPLGAGRIDSIWARRADVALAVVFVLVGAMLLSLRWADSTGSFWATLGSVRDDLAMTPWRWGVVALLLGAALGGVAAWKGWTTASSEDPAEPPDHWVDRLLDVLLPAALMVLVVGLFWGLPSSKVEGRLAGFAQMLNLDVRQFRVILTFGLPAVLCYTFVERSIRFGLGVGVLLLASSYSLMVEDSPIYQVRSFFGVLRVEGGFTRYDGYPFPHHRLVHGTTLHGKQFWVFDPNDEAWADYLRNTPLSYYHRTGPVGQVFGPYNTDPSRPMAVIGLGTGTMACYALPGQTLDFYDIDPQVVDISFDTYQHFTFVEDAEDRGVDVNLVLGDARLTFEPRGKKTRLKPLRKRPDEPTPARQYGPDIPEDFKYGLIVVDAFSSDAIPVHLITKQAVSIYRDRMLEDGILMMHISNRYLDLQPVLANIATELGMVGYHLSDDDNQAAGKNRSHWVALARKKEYLERILTAARWQRDPDQLSLLGTALYPAFGPATMVSGGLSYAILRIAEEQTQSKALKEDRPYSRTVATDWKPLETIEELERQLEEAESDEKRLELHNKLRMTRRVGVWTDDYSNLLSVFSW